MAAPKILLPTVTPARVRGAMSSSMTSRRRESSSGGSMPETSRITPSRVKSALQAHLVAAVLAVKRQRVARELPARRGGESGKERSFLRIDRATARLAGRGDAAEPERPAVEHGLREPRVAAAGAAGAQIVADGEIGRRAGDDGGAADVGCGPCGVED